MHSIPLHPHLEREFVCSSTSVCRVCLKHTYAPRPNTPLQKPSSLRPRSSSTRPLLIRERRTVNDQSPIHGPATVAAESELPKPSKMAMNFVTFNQDYSHLAVGMLFPKRPPSARADPGQAPREVSASSPPTHLQNASSRGTPATLPSSRCSSPPRWLPSSCLQGDCRLKTPKCALPAHL